MQQQEETHIHTRRQRGFTLVELMIGITIVGILVGIALPAYSSYTVTVRESVAMGKLTRIALALEQYYGETRTYEADLPALQIPDSDNWFDYSIHNSDNMSYRIDAVPEARGNQPVAFRLDHRGRQLHRSLNSTEWKPGWP